MKKNELITEVIGNWKGIEYDHDIEILKKNISMWLGNQKLKKEYSILSDLLENLDYYSKQECNKYLKAVLHDLADYCREFNYKNVILTFLTKKNADYNSSIDYWSEFRCLTVGKIPKQQFKTTLNIEEQYYSGIEYIVIIDDILGSGDSLTKFLESFSIEIKNIIKDRQIFYYTLYTTKKGQLNLKAFSEKNGFDIIVINLSERVYEKYFANSSTEEINDFKIISINRGITKDKDIFGYQETQSLVSFYRNTPNNTLGVIWMQTKNNQPFFPREKNSSPTNIKAMKKTNKKRKNSNYEVILKRK